MYQEKYKNVVENNPVVDIDSYNKYEITYGNPCDYEKTKRLGRGKYSEVYSGLDIYNRRVVMKFLKPVRKGKINREV